MSTIHPLTRFTLGFSALMALACGTVAVDGERRVTGECPRGEVCSELTPEGLIFYGMSFWDTPGDRLGPVLVGGKFQLQFGTPSGEPLPEWQVSATGGALDAETTEDGAQLIGLQPGSATVRVEDGRGTLYDRLPVDVVEIDDVEFGNVSDPTRTVLLGGCEEMIGVRLMATDGVTRLRAFDAEVQVTAVGGVRPDVAVWDCFRYDVPADATEVTFEVTAGGRTFELEVEVVPVGDPALCPTLSD
jgi:hypothetical protein